MEPLTPALRNARRDTGFPAAASLRALTDDERELGLHVPEKVLDLLTREFELMMRHAGTTSLAKLNRSFIVDSRGP